jgi:hypothetical protein
MATLPAVVLDLVWERVRGPASSSREPAVTPG